jgi:hypothetical protein
MASAVLGSYSKGTTSARSLNFGTSGSVDCDSGCVHNPANPEGNGDCYAIRVENRADRRQLLAKLIRHQETPPFMLVGKAILEVQELVRKGGINWLRISTNGAVPPPEKATPLFITQLRTLFAICRDANIKVHFPVESRAKFDFYTSKVGDLVAVRLSVHSESEFETASAVCSTSAGQGKLKDRVSHAKKLAAIRRAKTGRLTVVCPAVVSSFAVKCGSKEDKPALKIIAEKSKCGNCTYCSRNDVDVIYPTH